MTELAYKCVDYICTECMDKHLIYMPGDYRFTEVYGVCDKCRGLTFIPLGEMAGG